MYMVICLHIFASALTKLRIYLQNTKHVRKHYLSTMPEGASPGILL